MDFVRREGEEVGGPVFEELVIEPVDALLFHADSLRGIGHYPTDIIPLWDFGPTDGHEVSIFYPQQEVLLAVSMKASYGDQRIIEVILELLPVNIVTSHQVYNENYFLSSNFFVFFITLIRVNQVCFFYSVCPVVIRTVCQRWPFGLIFFLFIVASDNGMCVKYWFQ